MSPNQLISIVVPMHNEADGIEALFRELAAVTGEHPEYRWELIAVDDGSTDDTAAAVSRDRALLSMPVRLLRLSRNFGHQAALAAGVAKADGDAVVLMDADLQDPPELLHQFLARYEAGYDVVYAIRARRAESAPRRLAYKGFYQLFRRIAEQRVPLDAGDFSLISRRVADAIRAMPERDLLLRGLRSWVGYRQTGVPFERPARNHGRTKYGLGAYARLAGSALFGFSHLPLRVATWLGLATAGLSVVYLGFILIRRLAFDAPMPPGWASIICVVLLMGGVQLVTIGILGEYIGRIYAQTQARPRYIVAEDREL